MRYAAGRKEETRARILKAAGKVFRRHGYHASGVDKVMEEAGLTAGGFYAHFASKEALFAAMFAPTAAEAAARQGDRPDRPDRAWVEGFLDFYLSAAHRDRPEQGCPLSALISEVARAGEPVKASFEAVVRAVASRIESGAGGSEERALALVSLCVGGLGLARSVVDETLSDRILSSCRDQAALLLDDADDRA